MTSPADPAGTSRDANPQAQPFAVSAGDGVVVLRWRDHVHIDLALAAASVESVRAGRGDATGLLVDLARGTTIDRDAREYYQKAPVGLTRMAFVAGNLVSRVVANFFIGLNRPPQPTRFFENEEDALAWLRSRS